MMKRHLLLTNLLVFTGCSHQGMPRQNSDFWLGNSVVGCLSHFEAAPRPRVDSVSELPPDANSRDLFPEDHGPKRDDEIACVLGL